MLFFLFTILVYAGISIYLLQALIRQIPVHKLLLLSLSTVALICHSIILAPNIMTASGLNFNLFNSLSLTGLFFGSFFVLFSLYRPILNLGIMAVPLALGGLVLGYFGHDSYQPMTDLAAGIEIHILLSFAAYCLLLMAAVQGLILRLQIRELKSTTIHRFWVARLPSLQSMEALLFDMMLTGFIILSIALGLGLFATYDVLSQHLAHKLVFSILSWLVLGAFIIGHYRYGWRGKRAASFAIYGFLLLAVGFFGSKIVLELLIN